MKCKQVLLLILFICLLPLKGWGSEAIVIPETVSNMMTSYTVVAIGEDTFVSNRVVASVSLPASVTTIGNDVFEGSGSLTNMICLGTEPAAGGSGLFKDCANFQHIAVPAEALHPKITF